MGQINPDLKIARHSGVYGTDSALSTTPVPIAASVIAFQKFLNDHF